MCAHICMQKTCTYVHTLSLLLFGFLPHRRQKWSTNPQQIYGKRFKQVTLPLPQENRNMLTVSYYTLKIDFFNGLAVFQGKQRTMTKPCTLYKLRRKCRHSARALLPGKQCEVMLSAKICNTLLLEDKLHAKLPVSNYTTAVKLLVQKAEVLWLSSSRVTRTILS